MAGARVPLACLGAVLVLGACGSGNNEGSPDSSVGSAPTEATASALDEQIDTTAGRVEASLTQITPGVLDAWAFFGNTWDGGGVFDVTNIPGVPQEQRDLFRATGDSPFDAPRVTGRAGQTDPSSWVFPEGRAIMSYDDGIGLDEGGEFVVLDTNPHLGILAYDVAPDGGSWETQPDGGAGSERLLGVLDGVLEADDGDGASQIIAIATTIPQVGEPFSIGVRVSVEDVGEIVDAAEINAEAEALDLSTDQVVRRLEQAVGTPIVINITEEGFSLPQWHAYLAIAEALLTPAVAQHFGLDYATMTGNEVRAFLDANAAQIDEIVSSAMAPEIDAAQAAHLVVGRRADDPSAEIRAMVDDPSNLPLAEIAFTSLAAPLD
jgi:hypothetical protein